MGDVEAGVSNYLISDLDKSSETLEDRKDREGDGRFQFTGVKIKNEKHEETTTLFCNEGATFKIYFKHQDVEVSKIIATFGIKDKNNELIAFFAFDEMGFKLSDCSNQFFLKVPQLALRPGDYSVWLFASYGSTSPSDFCDVIDDAANFTILPVDFWVPGKMIRSRNTAFFDGEFNQPI
jgi:hypothetical protein